MTTIGESERELWFIYSPADEPWAGLRVATFVKTIGSAGFDVALIHNEMPERTGPRIWDDVREREQWCKVKRIEVPTVADVEAAMRKGAA
ncbi:hypothetical protein ACC806_34620 [Rhizobium ruizarguesonis]